MSPWDEYRAPCKMTKPAWVDVEAVRADDDQEVIAVPATECYRRARARAHADDALAHRGALRGFAHGEALGQRSPTRHLAAEHGTQDDKAQRQHQHEPRPEGQVKGIQGGTPGGPRYVSSRRSGHPSV